jgi:hypothetical protein
MALGYAAKLSEIWDKIHKEKPGTHPTRDPWGTYTEVRALTKKEWALVLEAISAGFPATIYGHGFFSSFALCVYEPSTPAYPGIEPDPKPVILVVGNQYPGNDPKKNPYEQKLSTSSEGTGGVFEIYEKICNTPENLSRLAKEGIDPPKSRGHYQY